MPGAGSRRGITIPDPAARLLDVTRLVSRAGRRPTGIDRVERAYLDRLLADPVPCFALLRTALGFLLLDRAGAAALAAALDAPPGRPGLLARLARCNAPERTALEERLRGCARARALPSGLGRMLRRHLPAGCHYLNVGHANFTPAVLRGLAAVPGARIGVLIHDTIPLDLPAHQRPGTPARFAAMLDRAGRHADLLIANSAITAADLARHLPAPRPEIVVAPLGVPRPRPGKAPAGPWSHRPYFVTLGTIEPRKNHGFLLDLWDRFGPGAPALLICGSRGWENHATFARLDAGPAGVHELPGLGDAEIFGLLAESAGLLFPSLAEGYGLPLLEAAALGVPVLCNDLPVFREVGGAFPIYAPVDAPYLWQDRIETLARQAAARDAAERRLRPGITPPGWAAHFNAVLTRI
ncbi:glycosyltransferase family 4 protein [Roseivivax sp. CAU 1761]